jgi:hypothetical protein
LGVVRAYLGVVNVGVEAYASSSGVGEELPALSVALNSFIGLAVEEDSPQVLV